MTGSTARGRRGTQAYYDTAVTVAKSQDDIRQLLRKHGASSVGIIENWHTDNVGFTFAMPVSRVRDGKQEPPRQLMVRMAIPLLRSGDRKFAEGTDGRERRQRQLWRALFFHLKAKFEAIEFGLEVFEEAFLPQIVTQEGKTIGEIVLGSIEAGQMKLALPRPT